jgi:hypothetical protein
MIRSQSISREIPYILLALGGLALILLVINVIVLENTGVQYGSSGVVQSAPELSQYWQAEAARWSAMADYYARLNAENMTRSWQADAARWNAMAEYYAGVTTTPGLSRSWQAEAARWNAMAEQGLAYDATGAMLSAVVLPTYNDQLRVMPVQQGLAYDATGAMLKAVVFPKYPDR